MRSPLPWADLNRTFPLPLTEITDVPSPESFRLVGRTGRAFMISSPDSPAGLAAEQRLADRIDTAARSAGLAGPTVAPVPSGWTTAQEQPVGPRTPGPRAAVDPGGPTRRRYGS